MSRTPPRTGDAGPTRDLGRHQKFMVGTETEDQMKRVLAALLLLAGIVALIGTMAPAQDRAELFARYLRTDIAAKKTQVMSTAWLLSPQEEKAFWPAYQEYQQELAKFTDARQALVQQYVKEYKILDDAKAKELMDRVFELQEWRLSLLRRYATEMQKNLPVKQVAKFVQVEAQI